MKLSHRVAYPVTLRVESEADPALAERLYRLFAVVVHLGSGPNSGHYVSLVRVGPSSKSWKIFDDDNVKPFSEANLSATFGSVLDDPSSVAATQTSYLLFYETVRDEAGAEAALEDSFHIVGATGDVGPDASFEARPIRIASVESRATDLLGSPSSFQDGSRRRHEFTSSAPSHSTPPGPTATAAAEAFGIPGLAGSALYQ